ncbi:hypothetical protein HanIR_Chr03g0145101 [Helianthus annuus]|nr:hypothetical protein HanIR_Chr03g0145101 [Helianthus annuus]
MDEISESEDFDYVINEEGIMTEVMDPKDQYYGEAAAMVLLIHNLCHELDRVETFRDVNGLGQCGTFQAESRHFGR